MVVDFCLTVRSKICLFAKFGSIGRGAACCSRVQNIEFAQKHFNEYINSYKYADLIFMYSREEHTVCEAHSALPYPKIQFQQTDRTVNKNLPFGLRCSAYSLKKQAVLLFMPYFLLDK